MAGIALGSAPFVVLMSQFMMKKQRDCQKKVREMSSRMMTFEAETFYNMDMIKSLGIFFALQHLSEKIAGTV